MNISYNWLKDYVNFDLSPEELSAALTSIGLETGGIEEVQTIKGGLNGLVIGKVLTCEDHPNSDHLHITTGFGGIRACSNRVWSCECRGGTIRGSGYVGYCFV